MLDTILAGLSGGATGLIGGAISSALDFFKQRENNKHEIKLAELDLKSQQMEFEHQARIENIIADKERDVADASLQAASYAADSATYSKVNGSWALIFVDVVRGLVRPALTGYLLYMCSAIMASISVLETSALTQAEEYELTKTIINSILYMANMAVSWWFGSRSKFKK